MKQTGTFSLGTFRIVHTKQKPLPWYKRFWSAVKELLND